MRKIIIVMLVMSVFSCKNASEKKETVEVADTSVIEAIEESEENNAGIDTSLIFPFAMDLSTFKKGKLQEHGAGDCWGTARKYTNEKVEIGIDSTNCDIYGFHNNYFLLNNEKLVRVHQEIAMSHAGPIEEGGSISETAAYILTEKVFDFSVKPQMQYVKSDTVKELNMELLQTNFVTSEIKDSQKEYTALMAQYSEIWGNSQRNDGEIILSENSLGTYRLEKGGQIDLYNLREVFHDFEVSKNVGEQDGPDYYYFTIGTEAQISTTDLANETLFRVLIPDNSSIPDSYGVSIGTSIYEVVEKRQNLSISTEHYHVFLYEEGSHIAYEMSLGEYSGPDKEAYTFEDIKNAKVIAILWE